MPKQGFHRTSCVKTLKLHVRLHVQVSRLVEITSNIWGTKFRFTGLASFLPDDLGSVTYKTSLLHLQPRQMTVTIFELMSELRPQAHDPDYNPNQFSESEDEPYGE